MADGDSFIQVPDDSTGKKVDAYELSVGGNAVQRQRILVEIVGPQHQRLTSANLSAGSSVPLTTTDITSAKTGKLAGITAGASVPLRVDVETVSGARVLQDTFFTRAGETLCYCPPHRDFITQAGGVGNGFGVTIFNLDPSEAADVYATIFWEEHD